MITSTPIARAVAILRKGGLVAFPTETVYGLGADARDGAAVRKIFAAKGRPAFNPLIVHVADAEAAKGCTAQWPAVAQQLADAFWPGPLTLVLPRSTDIAGEVTAFGPTVGVRVPRHPVGLQLLRAFDGPIAAPSANRSNHVSPTTAAHVRQEFDTSQVELILDGGPCEFGIESTVVQIVDDRVDILRLGSITEMKIASVVGTASFTPSSQAKVTARHSQIAPADGDRPLAAPGQLPVHYAPRVPAHRFERSERARLMADLASSKGKSFYALITIDDFVVPQLDECKPSGAIWWRLPNDPVAYGRSLYATLRELELKCSRIFCEMPPIDDARWDAVRDRLMRATRPLSDAGFIR